MLLTVYGNELTHCFSEVSPFTLVFTESIPSNSNAFSAFTLHTENSMSQVVSCRLSDEELKAFDDHLNKLGLADRSPFIKKLLLKEITNSNSFSLLEKEIELLDHFAFGNGKLSRRDAILKLLTQDSSPTSQSSNDLDELKKEIAKLRQQFVNTIMLAMADITHNINQTLGPNEAKGLSWDHIEKRITTLLSELENN